MEQAPISDTALLDHPEEQGSSTTPVVAGDSDSDNKQRSDPLIMATPASETQEKEKEDVGEKKKLKKKKKKHAKKLSKTDENVDIASAAAAESAASKMPKIGTGTTIKASDMVPALTASTPVPDQKSSTSIPPLQSILKAPSKPSMPLLPTAALFQPRNFFAPHKPNKSPQKGPYQPPHVRGRGSIGQKEIEEKKRMLERYEKDGLPESEDGFYTPTATSFPPSGNHTTTTFFSKNNPPFPSHSHSRSTSGTTPNGNTLGLLLYPALPPPPPQQIPRKMSRGALIVDENWGIVEVDDQDWTTQGTRTRSGTATTLGGEEEKGRRMRRLSYVGNEGDLLGLPSPIREDSGEEEKKGAKEKDGEKEEMVCTSCGCLPVPSFVALIPCDHLLCHNCMNALINSAAHKPPRDMTCFACSKLVQSFTPAWEQTPTLGLVEALKKSIKLEKKESNKENHTAAPRQGHSKRVSIGNTTSTGEFTNLSPLGLKNIWNSGQVPGYHAKEGSGSTSRRERSDSSSASAIGLVYGTPVGERSRSASGQFQFRSLINKSRSGSGTNSTYVFKPNTHFPNPVTDTPDQPSSGDTSFQTTSGDSSFVATPKRGHISSADTSFSTPELVEASPEDGRRRWSDEPCPNTPPEGHRNLEQSPQKGKNVFRSPLSMEQLKGLKNPVDWPVIRIDNIPWDVTVAEVTEWLAPDQLAPVDQCVLSVHILCNRADGRTLNQCYLEVANVQIARTIVRSKDGRKLRFRPVHVTLSSQTELMNTLFPSWDAGFTGMEPNFASMTGPLLLQTELTGLVTLCKLETMHAFKAPERPYFNIVTILQKFPWHQPDCYNSKQIVRLYNTACAAIETLHVVRAHTELSIWLDILCVMADAVIACPVFRQVQKDKFIKKTGLQETRSRPQPHIYQANSRAPGGFTFSPPSLREHYVTVGFNGHVDEGSPTPSQILELAPHPPSPPASYRLFKTNSQLSLRPPPALTKAHSTPNLFSAHIAAFANPPVTQAYIKDFPPMETNGSPKKSRKSRRLSSIAREHGLDQSLILSIAAQLGVPAGN